MSFPLLLAPLVLVGLPLALFGPILVELLFRGRNPNAKYLGDRRRVR